MRLSDVIDWDSLVSSLDLPGAATSGSGLGCPFLSPRLMSGLLLLQSLEGVGDESAVSHWVENPYWQYFCGYEYLQWELPCDSSSLTRWRNRLGVSGMEKLLSATIATGIATQAVKPSSMKRVVVDSTAMPNNITHPTDSKLLYRAITKLGSLAKQQGILLRQSYCRVAKYALGLASRYGHAKQFKRMNRQTKKLRTYLGRLIRDVKRKAPDLSATGKLQELLDLVTRLHQQKKTDKQKLYSLHEPDTVCMSKGKAHKPYEFGSKTSIVVTHKEGFVLNSSSLSGNPYDGHTLSSALKASEELTGVKIEEGHVDRGYRGHGITDRKIYISGQKQGITKSIKQRMKRRSMIEPYIGHMKRSHRLGRNYLKGRSGAEINAIMSGIGHNLAMILRKIILRLNLIKDFLIFLPHFIIWKFLLHQN